jgi:hypothetical protein
VPIPSRTPNRTRRHLRRRPSRLAAVVADMKRRNLALHHLGGSQWQLSSGQTVSPKTAKAILSRPVCCDLRDALFPDIRGQTFRLLDPHALNADRESAVTTPSRFADY